jgi:ATP-dependent Lon protease
VERLKGVTQQILESLEAALASSRSNTRNGPKRGIELPKIAPKMSEFALKSLKGSIARLSSNTADELSDILMSSLLPASKASSYPAKLEHLSLLSASERVKHAADILELLNSGLEARESVDDRFKRNAQRKAREAVLRGLLESVIQELRVLKKEEAEDNGYPDSPTGGRLPPGGVRKLTSSNNSASNEGSHAEDDDAEDEDEEDDLESVRKKIKASTMPIETRQLCMKELKRLQQTSPMSPEYGKTRDYLDWMIGLPWNKSTFELPNAQKIDKDFLERARKQLEMDHFGIEKVKRRLLQYLAVLRLKHEKWQEEEEKQEEEERLKADKDEKERSAAAAAAKDEAKAGSNGKEEKALAKFGHRGGRAGQTLEHADSELDEADQQDAPARPRPSKLKRQFRDKGPILCLV